MRNQVQDREMDQRMEQIDALVQQIEQSSDPVAQNAAREMVSALLELHGAGLTRILELLSESSEQFPNILSNFTEDPLIDSLLLLHGLHPSDLESRVRQALDKVRPQLESHGGNVELLSIEQSVVYLKMEGNCQGCPSSRFTLQQTTEQAIYNLAPDVVGIELAGENVPDNLIQLESLLAETQGTHK